VDTDATAPHNDDALFAAMQVDPALVADKLLRAIDLLDEMHKRQLALEARHKALKEEHRELVVQVATLASRFEGLTGAITARTI
jgi:hypothetical protein